MRVLFKFILLFLTFISSVFANYGHRGGGDIHTHLPENSLIVLEESLMGENAIQFHENFEYLEFDVQETKDHELVVFHDKKLKRMIPYSGENKVVYDELLESNHAKRASYKRLKIKDLTLEELRRFHLKGHPDQKIPTLEEYLNLAKELGLKKPVAVEIKSLHSNEGRERLLELVSDYYHEYAKDEEIIFVPKYDMPFKVGFLSFWWKFRKSFGWSPKKKKYWCNRIKDEGFHGVFVPIVHKNQCK